MAVVTTFVDKAAGNDANDGKDNIGLTFIAADDITWTDSTFTLTESGGHGYTFAAGDVIGITGGTGATVGFYEIASATSTTIVLVETTTLPRATNASDFAAGDLDDTADITSSNGPLATLDAAMNAVVGADDTTFYAVAGTDYVAFAVDTAVTAVADTCTVEGYTTTIGDDGKITVKGTLTDTIATGIKYCFKNIIFDAEDSRNNCVSFGSTNVTWRKCVFKSAVQNGVITSFAQFFWDCEFEGCAQDGIACSSAAFFNCVFQNNTLAGIDGSAYIIAYNCLFFNNASDAINAGAANDVFVVVLNCTFDGNGEVTDNAVTRSASFRGPQAVINSIIYDCANGIESYADERDVYLNNLMNSNSGGDFDGSASDQENTHVTTAPDFVNEGTDYNLNTASPAKAAGTDLSANGEMDIGAYQFAAGAGGGGLLGPSKRAGKQ